MGYIFLFLIVVGVPITLFIVIFNKIRMLTERVQHLEAQKYALDPSTEEAQVTAVVAAPTVSNPYAQRAPKPEASSVIEPKLIESTIAQTEGAATSPQTSPYARQSSKARPSTARTSKEWEMLVGGKILNRIGSIAVLLGVVFFLKYAFDNDWITPAMRCILGGVAGLAMMGLAERTRAKGLAVFTQGLVGAAIPILYFSVYAAYNFYTLVPQTVAFVMMVGVTVLGLGLSMRYTSLFLGVLSAVGGMIVPALLPAKVINTTGLMTYVLLLDVGLVAMVFGMKRWRVVASIAAAGTWAWWLLWVNAVPTEQLIADRNIALVLLAACGVLFTLADIGLMRAGVRFVKELERGLSVVSSATWAILVVAIVPPSEISHQIAWVAIGTWFAIIGWLTARSATHERAAISQYITMAMLAFAGACLITNSAEDLSTNSFNESLRSLAALAAIAVMRLRKLEFQAPLVVVMLITVFTTLYCLGYGLYAEPNKHTLLLNGRVYTYVLVAFSAWWISLNLGNVNERMSALMRWFRVVAFLIISTAIYQEIVQVFINGHNYLDVVPFDFYWDNYLGNIVAPAAGILIASLFIVLAQRINSKSLHIAGIIAITVQMMFWLVTALGFSPSEYYTAVLNIRTLTGLVLVAALVVIYVSRKGLAQEKWRLAQRWFAGLALLLVTFELCSVEAVWSTYVQIQSIDWSSHNYVSEDRVTSLWNQFHLILSGTWIGYAAILLAIGFVRRLQVVRVTAMALLGVSILKVFFYDLSFLGQPYRIVSFIALGLILIGASYLYARYRTRIFGSDNGSQAPSTSPQADPPVDYR